MILAVTGGIAAYKAAEIASALVQLGATVDVILTPAAQEFIRPLTFSALTRRPVHTDQFAPWTADFAGHVSLAAVADALLVAPATANAIARLALGLADDLLGAVSLSARAPLLVAPAMEHGMFHHPATQEHLATLRDRGAVVVGPESGRLASGERGDGRLADPAAIVGAVRALLGRTGPLAGRRLVVTAGGTQEPLDPVRYLGNRSSGRMGFALAQAAIDRGARVVLVTGPTNLPAPFGAELVSVDTAEAMLEAVRTATEDADALIMAAAVADFRPAARADEKIKKGPGDEGLTVELVRNPDILASLQRPGLVKVGFAAETENLIANAEAKLESKGLAMIVANDAEATIGSDDSQAILIERGKAPLHLPLLPKSDLAARIVDALVPLLTRSDRSPARP